MQQMCLECGGNLIQTESDVVCRNCGLIANQIYEKAAIQLIKAENSYGSQFGSISERPSSLKTLGTYIGAYQKNFLFDSKGSYLKISAKKQFKRLKPLNDIYLHFNGRQREYRGYQLLTTICSALQITDTAKADALFLFQKVHSRLRREIKLSSLIIGSLYLALRSRRENIELSRLVAAAQHQGCPIFGKDVIKAASMIRQHAKVRVTHVKSEEYLDNIISRLQRDNSIIKRLNQKINTNKSDFFLCLKISAKKLLRNFPQSERGGRNPFILGAAIIIAADIMLARHVLFPHCYKHSSRRGILTQKHIAKILDIAEFTLREHYLLLAKPLMNKEILISQQIH